MASEAVHYDVLIVGAGNAACTAALSVLEHKVSVGMLEKAAKKDRGGNSALTGHMRFVFHGVEDLDRRLEADLEVGVEDEVFQTLFPEHSIDVGKALGQDAVKDDPARGCLDELALELLDRTGV